MSRLLRWVLAAQVAIFAVWGARLATSHRNAATVWLDTEPVDPRDYLRGHYIELRYVLAQTAPDLCHALGPPDSTRPVYLRLRETGQEVETIDGPVPISVAVDCRLEPPDRGAETWIRGRPSARRGLRGIRFGIERFYVPEDSDLRHTRSGDVVAEVTINDAGEGRVSRLVSLAPALTP